MNQSTQIEEALYQRCVAAARRDGATSIEHLQRECRVSYTGAIEFLARMEKDGVIGRDDGTGHRPLL